MQGLAALGAAARARAEAAEADGAGADVHDLPYGQPDAQGGQGEDGTADNREHAEHVPEDLRETLRPATIYATAAELAELAAAAGFAWKIGPRGRLTSRILTWDEVRAYLAAEAPYRVPAWRRQTAA